MPTELLIGFTNWKKKKKKKKTLPGIFPIFSCPGLVCSL